MGFRRDCFFGAHSPSVRAVLFGAVNYTTELVELDKLQSFLRVSSSVVSVLCQVPLSSCPGLMKYHDAL